MKRNVCILKMSLLASMMLPSCNKTTERQPNDAPLVHKDLNTHASKTHYKIYLTFDDGPSAGSRIVDSLSRSDSLDINVFLVGVNISANRAGRARLEEYRRNPLIEMGNHSYTHAARHYNRYFKQPALVLADFERNRDSLQLPTNLSRLPGRNVFRVNGKRRDEPGNGREAADRLMENGYAIFGWDIEWRIKPAAGIGQHSGKEMLGLVEEMLAEDKTFLPGSIIILIHDQELTDPGFTAELDEFVRLARADGGFSFDHLSNYR